MNLQGLKVLRMVATCCAVLFGGSAQAVVIDIDNDELAKLMASGIPVIDVRTAPEWQQTGVVPGSHLLTFFDERGNATPSAWLEKARTIAKSKEPVIVICRSGNRTKAVSQFLSDQVGYAKVYNVKNGIAAWVRDGRTLTPFVSRMSSCGSSNTC